MNWKCAVMAGCLAFTGSMGAQSASNAAAAPAPGGEVFREIEDRATGDLWLVLRDPNQPGGPGRLVRAPQRTVSQKRMGDGSPLAVPGGKRPVIHTGDALTVEEHTPVVDTRLEGVALGPALEGAYFRARLKIGGKVVRVEAVAPGHAAFGPESEIEP